MRQEPTVLSLCAKSSVRSHQILKCQASPQAKNQESPSIPPVPASTPEIPAGTTLQPHPPSPLCTSPSSEFPGRDAGGDQGHPLNESHMFLPKETVSQVGEFKSLLRLPVSQPGISMQQVQMLPSPPSSRAERKEEGRQEWKTKQIIVRSPRV